MSDPLPAPSLSTVLQALLTALVSLPLVLLHLITSVLLRVSNGVDATLGPSSFTTFLVLCFPFSLLLRLAFWEAQNQERRKNEEAYRITFTCKPCGHRSAHRMSKQGYHRGTVLIQCPSCDSRHVMSDHLGVFFEKKTTLEDLLKEKGQTLTHGHTDGNLEFWEDGSVKSYDLEGKEILGARNDDKSA